MACLELTVTVAAPPSLEVAPGASASLSVEPEEGPSAVVVPAQGAALSATPVGPAALAVEPSPQVQLSIGEVCTVGSGSIVVLAASDGPLRTRDGGYFLLNPETNPEQ